MPMEKNKFENMYKNAIYKDYGSDKETIEALLNWGGKEKLNKTLFERETIQLIVPALNASNGFATSLISNEAVILTDKRLLFLENKLLGTLVTEISLKEASRLLQWKGNHSLLILNNNGRKKVEIFFDDNYIDLIKEELYEYM